MIDEKYKNVIEEQLDEKIENIQLLTETSPSYIFFVKGKHQYILKQSKKAPLNKQFNNHKRIYDLWSTQKDSLNFCIPKPYLISPDNLFIVMEYVDGDSLLRRLVSGQNNVDDLFRQTGRGLRQYHQLMTQEIDDAKEDLSRYEYMVEVLSKSGGEIIRERLNDFPFECKRVLFKDFSPSNVVVSQSGKIFFLDVQEAFYFGPFYYDLSRFIDVTKVFSIIKNPLFVLGGYNRVQRAVDAFLAGYGNDVKYELLKKMQYIHRREHVHIKMSVTPISGIVLKVLYKIIR